MTRFDVVKENYGRLQLFVEMVNRRLDEGWVLSGGMQVTTLPGSGITSFYQAMTLNEVPGKVEEKESSGPGLVLVSDLPDSELGSAGALQVLKRELGDKYRAALEKLYLTKKATSVLKSDAMQLVAEMKRSEADAG